jgi:hypothetical protein
VDASDLDAVLDRTDGGTASFLDELLGTRNAMTRTLLGSSGPEARSPGAG